MPSNEGHIHWDGASDATVNFLEQDLQLYVDENDGLLRIRLSGSSEVGIALPDVDWHTIPDTDPPLEARTNLLSSVGYIRIRLA